MLYEKNFYKIENKMIPLEVYKVQVALFGGPSVLIYNEDRTQQWEETKPNNVKAIREFISLIAFSFCYFPLFRNCLALAFA